MEQCEENSQENDDVIIEKEISKLIEESAENSAFSEVIEGGKVKSKEIRKKMNEIVAKTVEARNTDKGTISLDFDVSR